MDFIEIMQIILINIIYEKKVFFAQIHKTMKNYVQMVISEYKELVIIKNI